MAFMSTPRPVPSAWELAHLLAEPTRRGVFDAVRRAGHPVTRDDVATLTAINRRLAAFHLDRLSEVGLLIVDYARPTERRGGPGAGRPAKRYRAADINLDLNLPPRQYEFATRLLVRAITDAPTDAITGSMATAYREGKRIGELRRHPGRRSAKRDRADILAVLDDLGYEPLTTPDGALRLRNCPFRSAADIAPDLVCRMNCELVGGVLEGLGHPRNTAQLRPAPPDCCVSVTLPAPVR